MNCLLIGEEKQLVYIAYYNLFIMRFLGCTCMSIFPCQINATLIE